jgi:chromosome segregation ATPase
VSEAALKAVDTAQAALIAALDAHDLDQIEHATTELAETVQALKAAGAWRARADLRTDLIRLLKQADAARGRINALSDMNRRRLDRLVALTGQPRTLAYGRSGQLR